MKISNIAVAGSLESNDALVTIKPKDGSGVEIELDSIVKNQFKDRIIAAVKETLEKYNIDGAEVKVQDRGALDCTLKARTEAAILRGGNE